MEMRPRNVSTYVTPDGREPFQEWFLELKDRKVRSAILARLDRLLLGNFGDSRHLGEGLYELRIHLRAGYRVYLGEVDRETVLLLLGGTKRTQKRDIQKAKAYWQELRSRDL
jgi:putative addiction module killer protein